MRHTRGRWRHAVPVAVIAAGVTLGPFLVHVVTWRPLALVGEDPDDGFVRVSGVVHVHSTLSDGGGTPEEIIRAARAAGLGFVSITDHNVVDAKPLEGYRDGVLVLVGAELSSTVGHILALGLGEDPAYRFSRDARDDLEDVRDLGGFSFAAHPSSRREDLRWTGWDLPGPWGIELLNTDSEARRAGARLLLTVGLYRLNPGYALLQSLGSVDEALARWDEMLARRDVTGLAGADAHSRLPLTKGRAIRFPSYEALFALARDHLLLDRPFTGDLSSDRAAVLDALRRGRFYMGLDALAPAEGFRFTVDAGGQTRWTMGDRVGVVRGLRARAGGRLPKGARVILKRNGTPLAEDVGHLEAPLPGPGVYRVEVRVPGWPVPWVITNPVYVFDDATRAERERRAAWPADPPPPKAALVIDAFEGATAFQAGADSRSSVESPVLVPGAGATGGGAARLAFRLGAATPDHPHTFCALVDWTHRDLSGRSGLVFSIRADGVYRIWVQVRDENPASTDEGTEWWFASVRTTREWRRVALPFARFRSINRNTDGRLDLDKVRALVFVLDRGAVKEGTRGTIWLADLGVY